MTFRQSLAGSFAHVMLWFLAPMVLMTIAWFNPAPVSDGSSNPNSIVYKMEQRGCWTDIAPTGAKTNVAVVRFTGESDYTFVSKRAIVDNAINEAVFDIDNKAIDNVAGFCEV